MKESEGKSPIDGHGRIVITGATGFIGRHLAPALLDAGHEVAGTMEPGMKDAIAGIRMFPVDISTGEGIAEAFSGADAVVHLAARNHVLRETEKDPLAAYRRVNVEGTRNVVRAASVSGASLFIHLSSVKAMGEESVDVLDEDSPCMPTTPYGISKLESEVAVWDEADGSGMGVVIVRLPMAYGPRNKGNLPRMIRWADRGLPFPLFQPENLRSMIYVENVVAGVKALLKGPHEGVSKYILKDNEDCSTRRIYSAICRELGRNPLYLPVPAPVVRLGGMLSGNFRKITGSFRVSSEKIEREIGFVPPVSPEEGIARTVRWYRHSAR